METAIIAIIAALGTTVTGVLGVYYKMKPKTADPSNATVCSHHEVLEQKFSNGGRRMDTIETTLKKHGEDLTEIKVGIGSINTTLNLMSKK